ncbi:hypothetical protein F5Y13DRAFT_31956 [Hypoxylon sp. FL1857]|nr:hypothetical protein F5Y13DRAFT_31956 [Hypoxylon sp. FL1857]
MGSVEEDISAEQPQLQLRMGRHMVPNLCRPHPDDTNAMLLYPDPWPRVNDFLLERYLNTDSDLLYPIENV